MSSRPALRISVVCIALSAAVVPADGHAATEQELEARLSSLAAQVADLQSELAALKAQRPLAGADSGARPTAAAVESGPRLDWFGYGELSYSRPSDDYAAAIADVGRFVIGTNYAFDARTRFVSELEIEHAVSSADDPGEVEIEQAYVSRRSGDRLVAKYGLFLMPVGLLNESHEPTRYHGVFRNFVETAIIPTTWREGGAAFQGGRSNGLRWDAGVSTGFSLSKWDPTTSEGRESPLGSIHQELALASAGDLSLFGALNYFGDSGLRVGGSVFRGDSAQGQPGFHDNTISLWEGHARWVAGPWEVLALVAQGRIANTREVNLPLVGNSTLIPSEFFGRYVEGAYRAPLPNRWTLTPFARYEVLNTASAYRDLGVGLTPDSPPDEKVFTAGLDLEITAGVVFKADYVKFDRDAANDRFDLGIGYQF